MGAGDDDTKDVSNEISVKRDVSGTVAQFGHVEGGVHFHEPARSPVQLPFRTGALPPRATAFQPRAAAPGLARILDDDGTAVVTSSARATTGLVSGLGGVGKTQLALDYAERAWTAGTVDLLVWVSAESRDAVVSEFAGLAAMLTGFGDPDAEHAAGRFLAWLATTDARWLIVLDDLQHPRDLDRLWPPTSPTGRVLVTTRRSDAALRGPHRRMIDLDVFTAGEAHAYLHDVLAEHPHLGDALAALAATLGYLPLALAQATTYMLDRDLTCTAYLSRWRDRRNQLAALFPEPDWLPDEQRATVATTWSLSIDHANRLEPAGLAQPLLEIASVLYPNGIPAVALTSTAVTTLLAKDVDRRVTADQARDGLACLRRLNLITQPVGSPLPTVRVHALVQRATRDTFSIDRHATLARTAGDALMEIWPAVERDAHFAQLLRTNVNTLLDTSGSHLWEPDGHPALFRAGISLGEAGQVTGAHDYIQRVYVIAHDNLGPDHPDTLHTRSALARWRGEAGDPVGAADSLAQLLIDRLRVLGPDHPDTLITRSNLARWRGDAGDPVGAADAYEQVLTDSLRVLGPDHPDTLGTRHNLAHCRGLAGDSAGAADACEQLLADKLRVLGPDHPDTLITRGSLAHWRGEAGDPAGAADAYEQVLADSLRVLGPDHPHTLITRNNLARLRGEAGDAAGAADAFAQLFTDRMRVLGPDHPHTLITRNNLAHWRGEAGDPAGAADAYEQVLTDSLRVLGPDHPQTLAIRNDLAHWRARARKESSPDCSADRATSSSGQAIVG